MLVIIWFSKILYNCIESGADPACNNRRGLVMRYYPRKMLLPWVTLTQFLKNTYFKFDNCSIQTPNIRLKH